MAEPGLDYISYGIIMQEIERGDSGITVDRIGAGFTGDVSYLCLWLGGTKEKISAQTGYRRIDGLFWAYGTRSWLKSRAA